MGKSQNTSASGNQKSVLHRPDMWHTSTYFIILSHLTYLCYLYQLFILCSNNNLFEIKKQFWNYLNYVSQLLWQKMKMNTLLLFYNKITKEQQKIIMQSTSFSSNTQKMLCMSQDHSCFRSHGQKLCTLIIVTEVTILYAIPDGSTSADVSESDSLTATTTAQF